MTLRMDRSGRIILPKRLRERCGFKPGRKLDLVEQRGGVLLRPAEEQPSMVQVDGLWVHQGTLEPGANWERTLGEIREERIQSLIGSE